MDKDTQTLEQAITKQPKSYGSIEKAVVPINPKVDSKINIECSNCCIFTCGGK